MPREERCPECNKVSYTFIEARAAARRSRRRHKERVNEYRCKSGWWHIGHDVLRGRRRRK